LRFAAAIEWRTSRLPVTHYAANEFSMERCGFASGRA
jgi:hypothetical protein